MASGAPVVVGATRTVNLEAPGAPADADAGQSGLALEGGALSDEELLTALTAERRQSAGFEEDNVLIAERIQALNYIKGEMPDMPHLENRSKAVSTDVADAVETALPDLIEIFTAGDDVLAFTPNSADDEAQAEQETDYVKNVIFQQNPGFEILYDLIKDALEVKTGVAMAWWEDREPQVERFEGKTAPEVMAASQTATITEVKQEPLDDAAQLPTFSFTATKKVAGRLRIRTIPPEDFTIARDAVRLCDTTYCAFRSRPRAIELIERGVPREIVDDLPAYGTTYDETQQLARDTAGEHADQRSVTGFHDLRQVEIVTHFIKLDVDGSGPKLWECTTGNAENVLIEKRRAPRVSMAAITPYRVPHRFYGLSLADKLLEIQRQKTALKRMLLDSGYFALNQRMEVGLDKANQWTIADLVRNEPMAPVRSKTGDAVRPLTAGPLNFNVLEAIEASSVEAEQRTGIVRNAQGLAPDTLHATAHGALALIQAAQKRLRLMARVFAEGGIKDLYLICHAILREHADVPEIVRLRGKWVPVSPTTWDERTDMTINVGAGAAGKEQEVAVLTSIGALQEKIVQAQGGIQGPLVTAQNIYNLASKIAEKSGEKQPEAFFSDPASAPPPAPQPHPDAIKAQAQAQQDQLRAQVQAHQTMVQAQQAEADRQQQAAIQGARLELDRQKQLFEQSMALESAQRSEEERRARLALDREQMERDDNFRIAQLQADTVIRRDQIGQKVSDTHLRTVGALQQTRDRAAASFAQAVTVQSMKDDNAAEQREADLAIQRSEATDAAKLADSDGPE